MIDQPTESMHRNLTESLGGHGPFSLYVHIPYCRTKCLYCDFNSYATPETPWREYLQALLVELEAYRAHPFSGRHLTTLFFGGGTPSLFPPAFYEALLPRIFEQFPPEPGLELTMECNPGTVSLEALQGYHSAGVNRLSFGVQSMNPVHLKTLTRLHGTQEAIDAVSLAREAGFDNVSIDLMFGVPGQSVEGWEEELSFALTLPLEHLSVYNLTPEEGTALVKQLERGRLFMPDEAYLVEMYRRTRQMLREHGFRPYEISNFSRSRPCRHNLQYWTGGDYLGVGAGAHSFSAEGHRPPENGLELLPEAPTAQDAAPGGMRWSTLKGLKDYYRACGENRLPIAGLEQLSRLEAAEEFLLTRGRLMVGIDLAAFEAKFGVRARNAVEQRAQPFLRRELMAQGMDHIALTDEGVLVADSIVQALSRAADGLISG